MTKTASAKSKKPIRASVRKKSRRSTDHDSNGDSRRKLIIAAKKVFAESGFDGASVKTISQLARVNVSLVSYYFGGKKGLYSECLSEFGRQCLEITRRILTPPTSVEDFRVRLEIFLNEFIAEHLRNEEVTTILHRDCVNAHSCTQEIFQTVFAQLFECMVDFFRVSQKSGILRKEFDPLITAGQLMGGVIHALRVQKMSEATFGVSLQNLRFKTTFVNQAVGTLIEGLRAKKQGATS